MDFLQLCNAFWVGGLICAAAQVLIDKTKLTPARILTGYVCLGVFLGAIGVYEPVKAFAGAGATVPLTGFGNLLCEGVEKAIDEQGALGILSGGLAAASAGVCASFAFALVWSLIFRSKQK